jgi:dihydropteroate synthase
MHPRPTYDWHLRTRTLTLGPRTLIMAILNLTPDSFSDGGQFNTPQAALTQALKLLDEGADILDLGGESTRPNATPISPAEEQSRTIPIIKAILKQRPEAILSIDTYHATTARAAIEAGAEIINDVSGQTWDPVMAATCAHLRCGTILMHTRGTPQTWPTLPPLTPEAILPLVITDLLQSIATATAAGLPLNQIVIDPGFGFGKIGEGNFTLLAHLNQLQTLQLPLLAGLSRKSFLTKSPTTKPGAPCLDSETWVSTQETLLHATTAANTTAILNGAHILRVHEVTPAIAAATIADETLMRSTH